jgi:hypothetical protein
LPLAATCFFMFLRFLILCVVWIIHCATNPLSAKDFRVDGFFWLLVGRVPDFVSGKSDFKRLLLLFEKLCTFSYGFEH